MEFNGFTDKANDALNCALTCAMSMGHTYVGSEHILYGLCGSNGGVASHTAYRIRLHPEKQEDT